MTAETAELRFLSRFNPYVRWNRRCQNLALFKGEGRFAALPVVASRAMRLGSTVATVGFPNVGLRERAAGLQPAVLDTFASARCRLAARYPVRRMIRGIFKSACRCAVRQSAGRNERDLED